MKIYNQIRYFLETKDYINILFFIILTVLSIFLDVLSIGIIFPIMNIIFNENILANYKSIENFIVFISPFKFLNEEKNFHLISGLLTVFISSILFKNILVIYTAYFKANFTYIILSRLKKKFLLKITKIPFYEITKLKTTDIIRFLEEMSGIVTIFENLLILFVELLLLISIIIFLLIFDTNTSIVLVITVIFFSLILILLIKNKILHYGELRRYSESNLLFITNNIINGIKEIKLSGYIDLFINNFDLTLKNSLYASRNFKFISQIPRSYLEVIIATSIVIFFIANMYKSPEFDLTLLSSAAVFLAAGLRILPSIGKIINSYNSYKYYYPVLGKIYDFCIKIEKINIDKSNKIKFTKNIKLQNISFEYEANNKVFENLNFQLNYNDKIGLYGESGVGKSTLINIISGLIKPDKGSIYIDEKNIENNYLISNLSIVSQSPFFINSTIKENLIFGLENDKIDDKEILDILKNLNLLDVINKLDKGLYTSLGERGSKFSGGQLQRLSIARAILKKSNLLILDEATNSLDKKNEELVMSYILQKFKDKALIIISHDLNVLKNCDYVIQLNGNKIEKKEF